MYGSIENYVLFFENIGVELCFDNPKKDVSSNECVVIEIPSVFNNIPTHSVRICCDTVNPTPNILINASISNFKSLPSK